MHKYSHRSTKNLFSSYLIDEESRSLTVEHLKLATIYPLCKSDKNLAFTGGVVDQNGMPAEISLTKRYQPDYQKLKDVSVDWYGLEDINPIVTPLEDGKAIFLGVMSAHFGHFILETLSRVWFLIDNPKLDLNEYRICYLDDGYNENWNKIFDLIGIPSCNIIMVDRPMRFSDVIIPEQSFVLNYSAHPAYFKVFEFINQKLARTDPYRKIFLTKSKSPSQRGFGDEVLARSFAQIGFEIIAPEELDISDFMKLMSECHTLVASSGTNAHNSVFLQNGSKLICLNRSQHMHPSQLLIDQGKELDTLYIDCHFFKLPHTLGNLPCCYGITKELQSYFKDNNFPITLTRKIDFLKMLTLFFITYFKRYIKFYLKKWISRFV
jgi:capsular polysaccharide biosynthesis protein